MSSVTCECGRVVAEAAGTICEGAEADEFRVLWRCDCGRLALAVDAVPGDDLQWYRPVERELVERRGKSGQDVPIWWRGSVGDLLTDLEPLLTPEQLQELAGEAAVRWRASRRGRVTTRAALEDQARQVLGGRAVYGQLVVTVAGVPLTVAQLSDNELRVLIAQEVRVQALAERVEELESALTGERKAGRSRRVEHYRLRTNDRGKDVVVAMVGNNVELMLDYHANGTAESASLDMRQLLDLVHGLRNVIAFWTGEVVSAATVRATNEPIGEKS